MSSLSVQSSTVRADHDVVVVGGGHAAAQFCAGLVTAGLAARAALVCDEMELPYQRPPLSKAFLKSVDDAPQFHRDRGWYEDAGISLYLGQRAIAIDRPLRCLTLDSGAILGWKHLVLATGMRPRTLPALSKNLVNVIALRSIIDARRLRNLIGKATNLLVIGGGFVGLEVAATASALGKRVTVLELGDRLLARTVSPALAAEIESRHRSAGIDLILNARIGALKVEGDRVVSVDVDGRQIAVDVLLQAIGGVPNTDLAESGGLACDDGVLVSSVMITSDPDILAIGDCARFVDRRHPSPIRLESVQNATEQAKIALSTVAGAPKSFSAVPWFWSEQGPMRIQMAGLYPTARVGQLCSVRRAGANESSFTLFHFLDGELVCAESINAPMDHMASRKILELRRSPSPSALCDLSVPLNSHFS